MSGWGDFGGVPSLVGWGRLGEGSSDMQFAAAHHQQGGVPRTQICRLLGAQLIKEAVVSMLWINTVVTWNNFRTVYLLPFLKQGYIGYHSLDHVGHTLRLDIL
jgi:hypothetical protein